MQENLNIKEGATFYVKVPFSSPNKIKVHIDYVLPSKIYDDETLIVYRVFGKNKKWWHQFMCTEDEMLTYIELSKN
jgi:hypothetical protein